jgi:hypothetical protein
MITFEYPGYNPIKSYEIKNPIPVTEDSEIKLSQVITRNGIIKTRLKQTVSKKIMYQRSYRFRGLTETIRKAFIDFLILAKDQYLKITDDEGFTVMGILITDTLQSIETSRNRYEIEFVIRYWLDTPLTLAENLTAPWRFSQ